MDYRDGWTLEHAKAKYSELLQSNHSLCGDIERLKRQINGYRKTLERLFAWADEDPERAAAVYKIAADNLQPKGASNDREV